MSTNNYSWNETLKFSWEHIIAFVALIFISYVTYMGDFYSNGGDFSAAAIKVFIIDTILLITFIGAQILKGTDGKFNRSIIIERILIGLCPIAFMWSMIPYNHYWNVYSERTHIEEMFSTSIEKSKTMFTDYNSYANNRINNYSQHLTTIINNRNTNPLQYKNAGFSSNNDALQKENYIHTLQLQLLSQNTDSLQTLALKWIESANQGASVWNAFLIGNIDKISDAIKSWNNTLIHVSEFKMSNEPDNIQLFNSEQNSYDQALEGLQGLKDTYRNTQGISLNTIWSGILLFLMLLFPYFLQKRNTRAIGLYYLIPLKSKSSTVKIEKQRKNTKQEISTDSKERTDDIDSNDIYGGTF